MSRNAVLGAIAAGLMLTGPLLAAAQAAEVLVATGPARSTYHELGRGICRLVNRGAPGTTCRAVATDGARFNLANVRSGAFEFGLVRSDLHFHAVNGSGPFTYVDESYENLRSVMSLNAEPFTIVVRRDSGITRLGDLAGRRVNIGDPGSDQRRAMDLVMAAMGWNTDSFSLAGELPAAQQSLALCHGRIEAVVYAVGHPHDAIAQAAELCDAVLVPVAGEAIDRLVAEHPYLFPVAVPAGTYAGMSEPVRSFGVRTTLVAGVDVPAETVHALVAAVGDQLDRLRRMHPVLADVQPGAMAGEGLFAPLHDGAARYYRERGWLQ